MNVWGFILDVMGSRVKALVPFNMRMNIAFFIQQTVSAMEQKQGMLMSARSK